MAGQTPERVRPCESRPPGATVTWRRWLRGRLRPERPVRNGRRAKCFRGRDRTSPRCRKNGNFRSETGGSLAAFM